uniref:Anaphase-promoting complex subunit 4 WD40 domain-containing protein n=1 Tax=Rhodosorus marinus TaxID=101924 RepID=A0A7S2ZTF5_9RHOD|mmetsp:Transcript_32083/g.125055  ORF Transcript_32083/g.125055 Transcript_32083/m.125055 type:complete len:330 (+) Transcript_32083:512-1501(+)
MICKMHAGCRTVRDIVVDGSMMMSAGVDDFIRIYNVQKRKEVGVLVQHNGPVNCLDILHRKYALSGGDDGELCVWRSRDWELLRRLRAHKKPVLDAKFHPSGAAAVTIGGDRKLKLWDIVRAHEAFGTTLENDARQVEWMSKGDRVAIAHGRKISVFETEKGSIFCDMELPKRVLSMAVINRNRIAAVCEGGQIQILDVRTEKEAMNFAAHSSRIVGISAVGRLLFSADCRGSVRGWVMEKTGQPLCEKTLGKRINTLCAGTMSDDSEGNMLGMQGPVENEQADEESLAVVSNGSGAGGKALKEGGARKSSKTRKPLKKDREKRRVRLQ